MRRFCIVLTAAAIIDAWLTTTDVFGIGRLPEPAASFIPLAFVLLGDLRYFFFLESARSDGTLAHWNSIPKACAWTSVVPLLAQLAYAVSGSSNSRVLFLIYETLFVVLSLGVIAFYLPVDELRRQWTRRVTLLVIGYYALWATADAIILSSGADAGFLLRVLPNVLYYGGLVPVIAWTAPLDSETRASIG
ncbi:MAG: hypothetical protein R3C68_06545 [Myxococcota bacterium]